MQSFVGILFIRMPVNWCGVHHGSSQSNRTATDSVESEIEILNATNDYIALGLGGNGVQVFERQTQLVSVDRFHRVFFGIVG